MREEGSAPAPAHESHRRSIAKAVSWRMTGSLDTFALSWLITGSATFAGSIAVTEIATKVALYYLHERAWSFVRWGRLVRKRDGELPGAAARV